MGGNREHPFKSRTKTPEVAGGSVAGRAEDSYRELVLAGLGPVSFQYVLYTWTRRGILYVICRADKPQYLAQPEVK